MGSFVGPETQGRRISSHTSAGMGVGSAVMGEMRLGSLIRSFQEEDCLLWANGKGVSCLFSEPHWAEMADVS